MLDERDLKIIEMLKRDARIPISKIAEELKISNTAVKKRLQKLEETGVITGYTIKTNDQLLGIRKAMLILHVPLEKSKQLIREILKNSGIIDEAYYRSSSNGYMFYLIVPHKHLEDIKDKFEGHVKDVCPITLLEKLL